MKKFKLLTFLVIAPFVSALADTPDAKINAILEVQQYTRAIHIMAMLLVGFGFLMVFVKKYGKSALTATFLLVSTALPLYYMISDMQVLNEAYSEMEKLILAEFGAASLLIAAGAVLGRIKMLQFILLGLLFIPFYMLNEWIVVGNGIGIVNGFADTGGSIVIHAFGAIFGVMAALSLTTKEELKVEIESDATSDRYSMLGSMILWIFWPSFCAALVPVELVPKTVVNVVIALSGSTLATYFLSKAIRGKVNIADIANAALAGGVAIGATCDTASHGAAFVIGIVAGLISVAGFALLQSKQQKAFKAVDTCGVTNLHGLPGLFGGLAALPIVQGLNIGGQLTGIIVTIVIAVVAGLLTGKIISLLGRVKLPYDDANEFE
jgi:ammonium transporter Rh